MNGAREHIEKIWTLPAKITRHFEGRDGTPERKYLKPILRLEGQEDCLARLKVVEYSDKEVTIAIGKELECHGLGRYTITLHEGPCCEPCDVFKIEFCGNCKGTRTTSNQPEMDCDNRY